MSTPHSTPGSPSRPRWGGDYLTCTRNRGRTPLCSPTAITTPVLECCLHRGEGRYAPKRTLRVRSRHGTTRSYPSTLIGRQHSSKANKPASYGHTQNLTREESEIRRQSCINSHTERTFIYFAYQYGLRLH